METRELRIGNLLQVEAFKPATIETATVTHVSEDEIQCKDLRGSTLITSAGLRLKEYGIPLTPEWLYKFYWDGYNDLCFNSWFKLDKEGRLYYHNDYTCINVNYVHQLQNLYFALTGKELELK